MNSVNLSLWRLQVENSKSYFPLSCIFAYDPTPKNEDAESA